LQALPAFPSTSHSLLLPHGRILLVLHRKAIGWQGMARLWHTLAGCCCC
jgi:hypothetical protein